MSLKSKLEYYVKFNPVVHNVFVSLANAAIRTMGLFCRRQDDLILFVSDIGKNYTGSPRAIYERMRELGLDDRYRMIWAFNDPKKHAGIGCSVVKLDSPAYFRIALQSKYWVTDVNIERGLTFKKRGTRYLNTWHGSTMKTLGNDIPGRLYYDCKTIDYMCVNSNYDIETFSKAFDIGEEKFVRVGLPRNDCLYRNRQSDSSEFKERLGLPCDKKLILYAPTWRDTEDAGDSYRIAPPIDIESWRKALGDECMLAFRMHPITQRAFGIIEDDFCRDFSSFQPLNDLLLAADLLITDYSSLAFDFSILKRPVLCFGYDMEQYSRTRGLYLDLEELFPCGVQKNEDELLDLMRTDAVWNADGSHCLAERFNEFGGRATDSCIDLLLKECL